MAGSASEKTENMSPIHGSARDVRPLAGSDSSPVFLLLSDVGNSRIKFGLLRAESGCDVGAAGKLAECLESAAFPSADAIPWDRISEWLSSRQLAAVVSAVSGTNPRGVDDLIGRWPKHLAGPPIRIDDVRGFPLTVCVDAPEKVGIDRLLNAIAANVLRPADSPAILVDSGTATTIDFVTAQGAFAGGAILPGFRLSARSLHEYTALLPLVSPEELDQESKAPVGKNTIEAIRSGVYWGQIGAVKEIVRQIRESQRSEIGPSRQTGCPFLLLTGGGTFLLAPHFPAAQIAPHLSLQGLALVVGNLTDRRKPRNQ